MDRSRSHHILSQEEVNSGKTTSWPELEITGTIKNLSPQLWKLQHLTALYLNDNSLFRIPSSISLLNNLKRLDISNNKLRSLPAEIGDLYNLRELMLNNNYLRALPYELGKLFQLSQLGLKVGSDSEKSEILICFGFRAILWVLTSSSCSLRSTGPESCWTSCWTTSRCRRRTRPPGPGYSWPRWTGATPRPCSR